MKFKIERTSVWDSKPCDEAMHGSATYIDRRMTFHLDKAGMYCPQPTLEQARQQSWGTEFFSKGANHREEKGGVARDLDVENIWVIDIATLEDLLTLQGKYGDLIIKEEDCLEGITHTIEIYDYYRE